MITEEAMSTIYKASSVSLHVRRSNKAAIGLYRDTLGFEVHKVEAKYCEFFVSSFFFSFIVRSFFPALSCWVCILGCFTSRRTGSDSDSDLFNLTPTLDADGEDAFSMRLSLKNT